MALVDTLRTFMYVSLWGKPVISVTRGLKDLIKQLFRAGEQGFAYDINDLSTLYQDAAGTIPVTAAGQPVGLVLDKSKGALRGIEKWDDSTTKITGASSKVSPNVYRVYSPDASYSAVSTDNTLIVGRYYEVSLTVNSITVLGSGVALEGFSDKTLNSVGSFRFILPATTTKLSIKRAGSACDIQVSNISLKELSGNHAYQTTSASRPLLQRNATTGAYYLAFDGTDDFLVTSSIDFTATDKVSLFAGVRKLSDNIAGFIAELSAITSANNGSFSIGVGGGSGIESYTSGSKGTTATYAVLLKTQNPAFNAPNSAVISAITQTSSDTNILRLNGAQAAQSTADLGTGNYGNYPLYIGRRGGTTFPFNGHLYSLIGVARLTTDAETIALEKSIAKNTGVTL